MICHVSCAGVMIPVGFFLRMGEVMLRLIVLSLGFGLCFWTVAGAQQQIDAADPAEVLENSLDDPYYRGGTRAQRETVKLVPEQILTGTGFYFTNVRYYAGVGNILTDLDNRTLYASKRDRVFEQSSLTEESLASWEPIVITESTKLTGLWGRAWNEALGVWVLTLVDKPLYRFKGDEAPGEANGKNSNWYTLEVMG